MQTVSSDFTARTDAALRPIIQSVLMSFTKDYDAGIDFFTIGTSTIGGTDILKGNGSVIQEWDKYSYEDYSDRVLAVEVDRQTEAPTNPISLATADIVMDNHDDLFSPGNLSSPLAGFLKSRRPVRISLGFGLELIPKFIGVTDGKPQIDERAKTVTFHCIDFLQAIMDIPLDEDVMYINYRTDELMSAGLVLGGLDPSQFNLDYGTVIVPFTFFAKGSKLGDLFRAVAQAELGNLSMQEDGTPRFRNRQSWATNVSTWEFNKSNVLERQSDSGNTAINVVEVYSNAREVQAKQKLWESASVIELLPGDNDIFADFTDDNGALPVTSCDDPVYITSATTSLYATNTQQDGSGTASSGSITLTNTDLFSTSIKMTFNNSSSQSIFLTQLQLFATPAKVVNAIYVREQNDTTVGTKDALDEQPTQITNDLIQDETAATTLAKILIADRGDDDDQQTLLVKSVPQLQLGDVVTYTDENTDEDYFVTRISDIVNTSGYRQTIGVSKRTINEFFRIGISLIGGTDALGP